MIQTWTGGVVILPQPCSTACLGVPEVAVHMRVEDISWFEAGLSVLAAGYIAHLCRFICRFGSPGT